MLSYMQICLVAKENFCSDFLFASLDKEALLKSGQPLEEQILSFNS